MGVEHSTRQMPIRHDMHTPPPLLDNWRNHIGSIEPSDGDYEDWVETACRLHYGLKHLPDPLVRIPHVWKGDDGTLCGLPHYGMVMKYPTIDQIGEPGNANGYQFDPNVRMLLHRRSVSCSISPEDVERAFSQLAEQGVSGFKVNTYTPDRLSSTGSAMAGAAALTVMLSGGARLLLALRNRRRRPSGGAHVG